MLDQSDMQTLKRVFPTDDHEFIRGYTYLTEFAICERIEEVDPGWSFVVTTVKRDGQVTVAGDLTINGATRSGVGMGVVEFTKKSKAEKLEDPNVSLVEANEAEKSAATDALKRAARLFGIGRYILNCPKHVKDSQSLSQWFGQTHRQQQEKTQSAKPALVWPEEAAVEMIVEKLNNAYGGSWSLTELCGQGATWEGFGSGKEAYTELKWKLEARTEKHGWKGGGEQEMIGRFADTFSGIHHKTLLMELGKDNLTDLGQPEEAWRQLEEFAYSQRATIRCDRVRYVVNNGSKYLMFEAPRPVICYGRSTTFKNMAGEKFYSANGFNTIDSNGWKTIEPSLLTFEPVERQDGDGTYYTLIGIAPDIPL